MDQKIGLNFHHAELTIEAEDTMRGWTEERRTKQAEAIRQWQPWTRSTGPKTAEGKATVARNPWRGGHREKDRAEMRAINWALKHRPA